MGYRSDLIIVHSFMHKSHAREILTAFTLDKRCQEYDLTRYLKLMEREMYIVLSLLVNNGSGMKIARLEHTRM